MENNVFHFYKAKLQIHDFLGRKWCLLPKHIYAILV